MQDRARTQHRSRCGDRRSSGTPHRDADVQPNSINVMAQIDNAAPLAQQSIPKPHWHKVG